LGELPRSIYEVTKKGRGWEVRTEKILFILRVAS